MIRPACASDAETIARIYNHYVANTTVTFEEIGFKFGQWVDVGYWQKILSPQSTECLQQCRERK